MSNIIGLNTKLFGLEKNIKQSEPTRAANDLEQLSDPAKKERVLNPIVSESYMQKYIEEHSGGGGGVQKNYVVPQNTTFTTELLGDNNVWAHIFTNEGLFYADTLEAKIDGVDYTATYDSDRHEWAFSDSIVVALTPIYTAIIFLSDTQATSHTVEIYYEGVETIYAMYVGDSGVNSYCCAYENGVFNPHIEIPAGGEKMVTYPIVGNSKIINTGFSRGGSFSLDTSTLIGGTATTDSDNYQLITPDNNYFIVKVIGGK